MLHRGASRNGLRMFYLIAVLAFVASTGFSNRTLAFVVESPPKDSQLIFVAAKIPASLEQTAINHICRSANLPHAPLPAERLPAEWFLSPADAKNTVDAIQKAARTQRPVCSPNGIAPGKALNLVRKVGTGESPIAAGNGANPIGGTHSYPPRPQSSIAARRGGANPVGGTGSYPPFAAGRGGVDPVGGTGAYPDHIIRDFLYQVRANETPPA